MSLLCGGRPFSKLIVAVGDSNLHRRSMLRIALRTSGVREILEASDAAGISLLIERRPLDAIFVDQDLPGGDGIDFTHRVRRDESIVTSALPIILVVSAATAPVISRARNSGVTAFLVRPFSASVTGQRLKAAIEDPRPFVRAKGYVGPDRRVRATAQGFPPRRFSDIQDRPSAGEA